MGKKRQDIHTLNHKLYFLRKLLNRHCEKYGIYVIFYDSKSPIKEFWQDLLFIVSDYSVIHTMRTMYHFNIDLHSPLCLTYY